jgi:predicted HTH domain antitoxin
LGITTQNALTHSPQRRKLVTTINLSFPDSILDSYNQNLQTIIKEIKQVFIISEYQKGHLSLKQSANALDLPYRSFLELLSSRGVAIDALNEKESEEQYNDLFELLK